MKNNKKIQFYINQKSNWFFIGIGGCGMITLALFLLSLKQNVSGSDLRESVEINKMKKNGVSIKNLQCSLL